MTVPVLQTKWWWSHKRTEAWIDTHNPSTGSISGFLWAADRWGEAMEQSARRALLFGVGSVVLAVVAIVSSMIAAVLS